MNIFLKIQLWIGIARAIPWVMLTSTGSGTNSTSNIVCFFVTTKKHESSSTWVNDLKTLRAYGSKTDAYKVFAGMLDDGNPLDDWNELLKAVQKDQTRLSKIVK